MKTGDKIKIPDGYGEYCDDIYIVEMFRDCLGIFESDSHRMACRFTPLCDLYGRGPESEQGYIGNFGEYLTNEIRLWIDIF